MNMTISGSGFIGAGEYDNISISGSGKAEGFIRCKAFRCSGSFSGNSDIECEGDIHVSGSFKNNGELKSKELRVSGSAKNGGSLSSEKIDVSGSFVVEGDCSAAEKISVSGGFKCEGNLKAGLLSVSGGTKIFGDLEAEKAEINGGIFCGGLINAEELYIDISDSAGSNAESLGGSKITIENRRQGGFINFLFGKKRGRFTVSESVEGDEIRLEHTMAKTVTGRNVVIGKGCEIELVQYSENVEISPEARVGKCEKV